MSTAKHLKHTKSIWLVEAYSTYTKDNVKIVIDELITFATYLKGYDVNIFIKLFKLNFQK